MEVLTKVVWKIRVHTEEDRHGLNDSESSTTKRGTMCAAHVRYVARGEYLN